MILDMIPYVVMAGLAGWIWWLQCRVKKLRAQIKWQGGQVERLLDENHCLKAHISALERPADARQTMVMEPLDEDNYDGSLDHLDGPQMVAHINEVMGRVGEQGRKSYYIPPEPTHYVNRVPNAPFRVKSADDFRRFVDSRSVEWGDDWTKDWIPVIADSVEDARAKAPEAWRESRLRMLEERYPEVHGAERQLDEDFDGGQS